RARRNFEQELRVEWDSLIGLDRDWSGHPGAVFRERERCRPGVTIGAVPPALPRVPPLRAEEALEPGPAWPLRREALPKPLVRNMQVARGLRRLPAFRQFSSCVVSDVHLPICA